MKKSDLVKIMAERSSITEKQASLAFDAFLNSIINALKHNIPVKLEGFGTFSVEKGSIEVKRHSVRIQRASHLKSYSYKKSLRSNNIIIGQKRHIDRLKRLSTTFSRPGIGVKFKPQMGIIDTVPPPLGIIDTVPNPASPRSKRVLDTVKPPKSVKE